MNKYYYSLTHNNHVFMNGTCTASNVATCKNKIIQAHDIDTTVYVDNSCSYNCGSLLDLTIDVSLNHGKLVENNSFLQRCDVVNI